jgi:MinD-like ATPase involved in chromosome partitioning or flagellar assembly
VAIRQIISVHSYRGGTGKSNVTANLAVCAANRGKKVAVLDTDLQSPGIHVLFGFDQSSIRQTLVDFLWGKCEIQDTVYDVRNKVCPDAPGECWLVPASMTTKAISRILDEGYEASRLNSHFDELMEELDLDALLIDTHPGLNRETMLTSAISDVLVLMIRPDQQDYYGTAVLAEVANKLEIPEIYLVANKVLPGIDDGPLKQQLQEAFGYEVLGMIPLSEQLAALGSRGLFVQEFPDHEVSAEINQIANRLFGD